MINLKSTISIIFITVFGLNSKAQFYSQENTNEAKEMAAICNSFTFLELYKSDASIIPGKYEKTFTSGVFGMDNKYQVYKSGSKAVINLRGSTAKKISWMENIYSSMIPAKGEIKLEEETFKYNFSNEESAGVHAGYTLGIAFFAKNVVNNIKALNYEGIYDITITGHSQGGALAILLRAYLEHLPSTIISEKNNFQTYAFAHPKVGNGEFVSSYKKDCKQGTSYSIVNVKDIIPRMPLSIEHQKKLSTKESVSRLFLDESYSMKDVALGTLGKVFGGTVDGVVKYTSESALKQISKKVGEVSMPNYIDDVDYVEMGNRIELMPFEYPKILKDPEIVKNDSLVVYHKMNEKGEFEDESVYKGEPTLFQHKTYNYYTGFLKKYAPKEYQGLEVKFLPENL